MEPFAIVGLLSKSKRGKAVSFDTVDFGNDRKKNLEFVDKRACVDFGAKNNLWRTASDVCKTNGARQYWTHIVV